MEDERQQLRQMIDEKVRYLKVQKSLFFTYSLELESLVRNGAEAEEIERKEGDVENKKRNIKQTEDLLKDLHEKLEPLEIEHQAEKERLEKERERWVKERFEKERAEKKEFRKQIERTTACLTSTIQSHYRMLNEHDETIKAINTLERAIVEKGKRPPFNTYVFFKYPFRIDEENNNNVLLEKHGAYFKTIDNQFEKFDDNSIRGILDRVFLSDIMRDGYPFEPDPEFLECMEKLEKKRCEEALEFLNVMRDVIEISTKYYKDETKRLIEIFKTIEI